MDSEILVQILSEVLRYLEDDSDKISVLSTCKAFRTLIPCVVFRGVYDAQRIRDTPYTFTKIELNILLDMKYDSRGIKRFNNIPRSLQKMLDMKNPMNVVTRLGVQNIYKKDMIKVPPQISHLSIYDQHGLRCLKLPETVTHLRIIHQFLVDIKNIPDSVTHLTICSRIVNLRLLPKSVTHLCIDPFNRIHTSLIVPHGVTHFTYGLGYDGTAADLPKSCTHLKIYANLPYSLWLPDVTHLRFKGKFNRSIERWEMPSLTHLSFHKYYKHQIQGFIPPAVTYLKYCGNVYRGQEIDQFR